MPNSAVALPGAGAETDPLLARLILNFIGRVPGTSERADPHPEARARAVTRAAASKAAMTAGGLALPPGPLGWLTIVPELLAVWKLQTQMVADIAAIYGNEARVTREQMLYCLFRHTAAQAVRDLAVRVGQRYLVQQASLSALQAAAHRVGLHLTQHAIGKGVSRWLPVVGAIGVGAYAYYDTRHVARTAIELFAPGKEIEIA
ncbi:MAG: hypothetical protein WDN04_16625 [Rhodospirillales bacterium]